ncbi:trypsin epsilon-like [Eurosta solidaginis]|uniref:trypsin epsilon-like n=1 Tax=Eurosta solidaginis TaxID=178769 RepID=UPI003530B559
MDSGIFFAILSFVLSCHFAHTNAQLRVLNGNDIAIEQTPHTVAILLKKGYKYKCVGALVSMELVVTSAKCVAYRLNKEFIAIAGIDDLSEIRTERAQQREVHKIRAHNQFNFEQGYMDIAVVTVDSPFSSTNAIKSISICPKDALDKEGTLLKVSGWGSTELGSMITSNRLQTADLRTMDKEKCRNLWKHHGKYFADTIMCAGRPGQNPYYRDRGAGGLVGGQLCALVSRADESGRFPSIFTDLTNEEVRGYLVSKGVVINDDC